MMIFQFAIEGIFLLFVELFHFMLSIFMFMGHGSQIKNDVKHKFNKWTAIPYTETKIGIKFFALTSMEDP